MTRLAMAVLVALHAGTWVCADDWPMFGRDRTHNAVSPEKKAPVDWQNDVRDEKGVLVHKARNIAWTAELGSLSLGGPVISDGLVWVGTNNGHPRDLTFTDPKRLHPITKKPLPIDMGVLMCFRERDGKFLWQYASPRLATTLSEDWPHSAMGGAPLVEGDRLWFMTNRCEVVALDIGPLKRGDGVPKELWKVDMRKEFDVFQTRARVG